MSSHLHCLFGKRSGKYYILQGNLSEKEIISRGLDKDITHHFEEEVFDNESLANRMAAANYQNVWLYEAEVTPSNDGNTPSTLIIKSLGTYFLGNYSPPARGSFV